jgi:tyrosine-protein phosphatase YwqE
MDRHPPIFRGKIIILYHIIEHPLKTHKTRVSQLFYHIVSHRFTPKMAQERQALRAELDLKTRELIQAKAQSSGKDYSKDRGS